MFAAAVTVVVIIVEWSGQEEGPLTNFSENLISEGTES